MSDQEFIKEIIEYADAQGIDALPHYVGERGLSIVRSREPTAMRSMCYVPLVCLVLQGRKTSTMEDRTVSFGAGDSLIVSLELPADSQIVEASGEVPYVALALEIDLALIRTLSNEMNLSHNEADPSDVIAVGEGDPAIGDTLKRLFRLHRVDQTEREIMTPMLIRECHFRLLHQRHGGMLRRLAEPDSHASKIHKVVHKIKEDFASSLQMTDLARHAGMSVSSFHDHFKRVMGSTPLQYKKNLCLLRAKERLSIEQLSVTEVAFEVGYESPTQFSREYARKFGHPPSVERSRRGA
jgi:AraC-like DNA-binding protein